MPKLRVGIKGKIPYLKISILESDINELEMSLDHANKANIEETKQIKRLVHIQGVVVKVYRYTQRYSTPTSLEYRSGNEDCVTRRVRYSCTVIGR